MSTVLTVYAKSSQPPAYGALALAIYCTQNIDTQQGLRTNVESVHPADFPCILSSQGNECNTNQAAIKSLAQAFSSQGLCGNDKSESDHITNWLEFAELQIYANTDFVAVNAAADVLDHRLTLRSYLVGYRPTAADFAVWGAMRTNGPLMGILKKNQHPYLARYFAHIDSLPACQQAFNDFQSVVKAKGKSKGPSAAFELGLPNAIHGQVVTRFPPEPSGYLHIGHAKAALLNQHFAQQYDGKMLIRFDDTNPSKEKAEFQDAIMEDCELMGIKPEKVSYTSDYFDDLFKYAIELIKRGKAYTDDTLQEQMREERMNGIASKHRDDSLEDNLTHFAAMQTGSAEGLRWCLRAKISVDNPNKAMRDPVIYRCNLEPHHRTGTTWKIYPGYDFACPIVDSVEGVTHALRSNEYRDRLAQYQWMLTALDLRKVEIWEFSRTNFIYTLLSKRKLKALVEGGLVSGWDDPRFPTIRGIRRRGLTIEGLKQYMLAQGPSQSEVSLEWDNIWATNKKIIDPIVPRHAAVLKKNVVPVQVAGLDKKSHTQAIPKHKKNLDLGNKTTTYASKILVEQEDALSFGDGEEITLMDWGNAIIRKKETVDGVIKSIQADLHLEGDFKKTSKKVHWLAEVEETPLIPVTLLDYDYLITKKKLEEDDKWEDFVNPVTEFREEALADANVSDLKQGDIIQFERKGYYIVDKLASAHGQLELILIPDGRSASVELKATTAKGASAALEKPVAKVQLPHLAPNHAITTVFQDEHGFPVPVTTKMFHVEAITDNDPKLFHAKHDMYKVAHYLDTAPRQDPSVITQVVCRLVFGCASVKVEPGQ